MSPALHCCAPTDTVERALASMRQHQVHRMPVVDGDGRLTGMLSMADLLLATKRIETKQRQPLADAIIETLSIVRKPRVEPPLPTQPSAPATTAGKVMGSSPAKATPTAPLNLPPTTIPAATKPAATKPAASKPAASKPAATKSTQPTSGTTPTGTTPTTGATGSKSTGNTAPGQGAKPTTPPPTKRK
jgi:CBS domain-containing protein